MINYVKTVKVNASVSYDVLIGKGVLKDTGALLKQVLAPCKLALITDDTVNNLYAEGVVSSLISVGFNVVKFVFPHGEESKNLNTYGQILNFLAENQLTRTDAVVALGGGVVGDMAGFAAATYLRGIKYVQIPTTLLAQIDSSVGGKTAIDLESGKNLVGAFCQPVRVICDVDTLKTLPDEIYADGMGEAVKYAALDKKVFEILKNKDFDICDLVYLSVDYKRIVVEKDEFESGLRKLLNLGHTPAHGIEKLSNYTISHGKAVSMGLQIILKNSLKHRLLSQEEYDLLTEILRLHVGEQNCPYTVQQICAASVNDKKRSGDYITLVMAFGIGDCRPVKIEIDKLWGYLN